MFREVCCQCFNDSLSVRLCLALVRLCRLYVGCLVVTCLLYRLCARVGVLFRLLKPIIDRCVMVRGLVLNCYLALCGCFFNHERGGFHDLPDCIRVMLSYPVTRWVCLCCLMQSVHPFMGVGDVVRLG